ncbi:MAG: hypothetical protein HOL15_11370 [Nitrospinaceae bacterium]|nr:hypothetical protein [Nitrospinaceae bacterium]
MKLARILLLTLCLLPLMVGCGTVGKNFDSSKVENIQNNVTTQLDILNWFGVPYKEGKENNHAMWTYQLDTWQAIGDGVSKGLVILFDDNNIVKAYRYESSY